MKCTSGTNKIVIFPIRITKNDEKTEFPYLVYIPDLDGMTEAKEVHINFSALLSNTICNKLGIN